MIYFALIGAKGLSNIYVFFENLFLTYHLSQLRAGDIDEQVLRTFPEVGGHEECEEESPT